MNHMMLGGLGRNRKPAGGGAPVTVTIGNDTTGRDYSGCETNPTYDGSGNQQNSTTSGGGAFFIRFTGLSNLVAGGRTVTDAKLYFTPDAGANPGVSFNVREFRRLWVVSQASWADYATSSAWTTPGGLSEATDIQATNLCTMTSPGGFATTEFSTTDNTNLIAVVQAIIDGGTNYGLRIWPPSGNHSMVMAPGTDGSRPYLEVTYTT